MEWNKVHRASGRTCPRDAIRVRKGHLERARNGALLIDVLGWGRQDSLRGRCCLSLLSKLLLSLFLCCTNHSFFTASSDQDALWTAVLASVQQDAIGEIAKNRPDKDTWLSLGHSSGVLLAWTGPL